MSLEIAKLETVFTGNTRDVDSAFDRVERRAQAHVNKVNQTLGSLKSLSSFAAGAAGGIAASLGLGAIGSLKDASSAILEYSANLEQTKIAFTTLMKSSDEAQAHLKELEKFAAETPFEFPELTQASRRFQNMGLNAKQVIPLLRAVGDAVAAAGGGSEQIDGVSKGLSDIIAKGRVQNEELLQLSENGVAAYELLSKALGKSKAEVIKLASEGKISSDVFLEAFKHFSQQNFGDAMEKQSKTFSGAMSTIKDSLLQTSNTAFDPLYKEISEIAVRIAEQSKNEDLSGVISAIIENISRGITTGAVSLGKAWVNSFIEGIKSGDIESVMNALFFGSGTVLKSIGRGVAEEIISSIEQNITGDLRLNVGVNSKGFSKDMLESLTALENTKVDTANLEKVKDVFSRLNDKLAEFGDQSVFAATKQQLLKIGADALTSSYGQQTLQIAAMIDRLNESTKATEKQIERENERRNQIASLTKQMREFASNANQSLASMFDSSRLGEFNRWLEHTKIQFGEVFDPKQIERVVAQLKSFDEITAILSRVDMAKQSEDAFAEGIQSTVRNLVVEFRTLQADGDALTAALTEYAARFRATVKDANTGKEVFLDLDDGALQKLNAYLHTFADFKIPTDKYAELSGVVDELFNNFTARGYSSEKGSWLYNVKADFITLLDLMMGVNREKQRITGEDIEIKSLRSFKSLEEQMLETLNKDAVVTAKATLEKTLLSEQYKNLTEAQRAYLMGLAAEIDAQEAYSQTFGGKFAAFKKEVPGIGDALEDSFLDSLDSISSALGQNLTDWRQGIGGMLKGIGLDFADLCRQMAAELMRVMMMQLLMKAIGGLFGGLLGGAGAATSDGGSLVTGMVGGLGIPGRASGGDVKAGFLYRINEKGEEFFMPKTDGYVYSHEDSMNLLNSLGKRNIDEVMTAGESSSIGVMNQSNSNSSSNVTNYDNRTNNIYVTAPSQQGGSRLPPPSERQYLEKFARIIADKVPKH